MSHKNGDYLYTVHKFGGTSLANADRFISIKSLLSGNNEIIVVSATQHTTETLQMALDTAKENKNFSSSLDDLTESHSTLINTLLSENKRHHALALIKHDINKIKNILHSVQLTGYYSNEIQHFILGFGELWSAAILTCYLGEYHTIIYIDASTVLYIYEKNGVICIDWEKSQAALNKALKDKPFDQIVITGFIASTLDGRRTTLGRNGSDFSAAIFAKLFKATCLTIWTDVDGIFTADPNRVHSAFVIDSLSYKEALELAYFGAKILHPMTIAPVVKEKIPIYIKNSLNPTAQGTHISAETTQSPYLIKGLTYIDSVTLINIEGAGMIGVSGIAARVFQILHEEKISVILISQASSEQSICFTIENKNADAAMKALSDNLQFEIERQQIEGIHMDKSCSILSVVGDAMVGTVGISGRLCESLAKANINIRAMSQGSSERNISVVISRDDVNKALKTVHASFYLSRKTISIGLIGPGTIGKALLGQIHAAASQLQEKYQVNLYIRGIINSKKMLLSHKPIDLETWQKQFHECNTEENLQLFTQQILADDVPHAAIIDCTASQHIAQHYISFIEKGIHIITPNKQANAGDQEYYKKLRTATQKNNKHYLYEATVCAGLPIINTLQDIIKTGDEVEKIEGVLSGTLSYIFNKMARGELFSKTVIEAKQRGYTEPDPREDLSGMDVARKLVCLAREIGYTASLDDVKTYNLVPEELQSVSVEEFLEKLPLYDNRIEKLMAEANLANKKIYYVASIHPDHSLHVKMETIAHDHPFSSLQNTDNMLIFHTKRYYERPLVIQGPGAGAEVTASGIFADLLRLVSYLS